MAEVVGKVCVFFCFLKNLSDYENFLKRLRSAEEITSLEKYFSSMSSVKW